MFLLFPPQISLPYRFVSLVMTHAVSHTGKSKLWCSGKVLAVAWSAEGYWLVSGWGSVSLAIV